MNVIVKPVTMQRWNPVPHPLLKEAAKSMGIPTREIVSSAKIKFINTKLNGECSCAQEKRTISEIVIA